MRGMRDMLALMYWVDNSKSHLMEASLNNLDRPADREKTQLLKALAKEAEEQKIENSRQKFCK